MLTRNHLLVLFPQYADDLCKPRPNRCLFGSPDPMDTRILLEEQFVMDTKYMLRRYSFDIVTGRPVTSICSSEKEKAETKTVAETGSHDRQNSCPVPAATKEEVGNQCIPESEVRNRSVRFSPYNRQTRITGKRQRLRKSEYGQTCGGSTVLEF